MVDPVSLPQSVVLVLAGQDVSVSFSVLDVVEVVPFSPLYNVLLADWEGLLF